MDLRFVLLFALLIDVGQGALQDTFQDVLQTQFVHSIEEIFVVQEKVLHRLFHLLELTLEDRGQETWQLEEEIGRPTLLILAVVRGDRGDIATEGRLKQSEGNERGMGHRRDVFEEANDPKENRRGAMQLIDDQHGHDRVEDRRIELDLLLMEILGEMQSADSKGRERSSDDGEENRHHLLGKNLFGDLRARGVVASELRLQLSPVGLIALSFDRH